MGQKGNAAIIKPEAVPICFARTAKLRGDNPAMYIQRHNREYMWTWS